MSAREAFRPAEELEEESLTIFSRINGMLGDYVRSLEDREHKVVEFKSPTEINEIFADTGCEISLKEGLRASEDDIVAACATTLRLSVRTGHPHFFNQLIGRADVTGLSGEMLTVACNASAYTFEVAPVFVMVEKAVVDKTIDMVGISHSTSEGLFVPGGSLANVYSLQVARYHMFPEIKTRGIFAVGAELVAYCSAGAHYSYKKAAHLVGIGSDNMVEIPIDGCGRMRPELLEEAIEKDLAAGKKPFFVGGTAGTTVWGAFDDPVELRRICDKFGLWFHLDGAWGGAVIAASEEHREKLLPGVEKVDSFCWNPHKMVGAPMQCSVFVQSKGHGLIHACNGTSAPYLFQKEKNFSEMDRGDWTFMCGRRPDAFKVWLAWKHIGDAGIKGRVDHSIALGRWAADLVKESGLAGSRFAGRFVLHHEPEFANVCFWYLPPALSHLCPENGLSDADSALLSKVTPFCKDRMQREGMAMITFTGLHNFFRWTFASPRTVTFDDVEAVLRDIDHVGQEFDPYSTLRE